MRVHTSILIVSLLTIPPLVSEAAWSNDPGTNVSVCNAVGSQREAYICSDGAGGMIVVWEDERSGASNSAIYAQRIDVNGNYRWANNGVRVCTYASEQEFPKIAAATSGGALIAWVDHRGASAAIYAQRLNSSGQRLWGNSGVAAAATPGFDQAAVSVASDGAGGALLAWQDSRSGTLDVYLQRINSSGLLQWGVSGKALMLSAFNEYGPKLVSDGAGGMVIAWVSVTPTDSNILCARYLSNGSRDWTYQACTASGNQNSPRIIPDGSGGGIIAWRDLRNGNDDIYIQHVEGNGSRDWAYNGVAVVSYDQDETNFDLCNDGMGGAIVAYDHEYSTGQTAIYAQRISDAGVNLWGGYIRVTNISGDEMNPCIASDGDRGAYLAWEDDRDGGSVYAQRLNSNGQTRWTYNGVRVSRGGYQYFPRALNDGMGGALLAWYGLRSGNLDVYAQRLDGDGNLAGGVWSGSSDLGAGWKWLDWFGFFADMGNGWIKHGQHDWVYASGSAPGAIWLYMPGMGWLYTNSGLYPYMYRSSDHDWLWYLMDSDNPRWFNNLSDGVWESH